VPLLPGAIFTARPQLSEHLAEHICSTLKSQGGTPLQTVIAGTTGVACAANTPWWGPLTNWTFASSVVGAAAVIACITTFRPAPTAPLSATSAVVEVAASRPVIVHIGSFDLFSDMTINDHSVVSNEQPAYQIAISSQVITCNSSVWDQQGLPSRFETSAILTPPQLTRLYAMLEDGKGDILWAPKIIINPDQSGFITVRQEQAYVCDYNFIGNKLVPEIGNLISGFQMVCRCSVAGNDVRLSLFNYQQVIPLSFVTSAFSYPSVHTISGDGKSGALQYPIDEPEVGLRRSELAHAITIPQDRTLMMVVSASELELHRGNAHFARQLGQPITQTPSTMLKQLPLVEPLQIVLLSAKIIPVAVEDDSEDLPAPVGIAVR